MTLRAASPLIPRRCAVWLGLRLDDVSDDTVRDGYPNGDGEHRRGHKPRPRCQPGQSAARRRALSEIGPAISGRSRRRAIKKRFYIALGFHNPRRRARYARMSGAVRARQVRLRAHLDETRSRALEFAGFKSFISTIQRL